MYVKVENEKPIHYRPEIVDGKRVEKTREEILSLGFKEVLNSTEHPQHDPGTRPTISFVDLTDEYILRKIEFK